MLFEGSIHRGVEQWLARQAHNLEAVGSNPIPATKKIRDAFICIFFTICYNINVKKKTLKFLQDWSE